MKASQIARAFRDRAAEGYSFNRESVAWELGIDTCEYDSIWDVDEVLWVRLADLIEENVKVVE